jgi:hypothetical protein
MIIASAKCSITAQSLDVSRQHQWQQIIFTLSSLQQAEAALLLSDWLRQ